MILTTPLVRALREKFPEAKITYLVGNWSKKAIQGNPHIDRILGFDDRIIFDKKTSDIRKMIKRIKQEKFDMVFLLDKSWFYGVFGYLCKIPVRIGFDRRGEGFANTYNDYFDGSKHEIEYYMDLAAIVEANTENKDVELFVSKEDEKFANNVLKKNKIESKFLIGIAPGGAKNLGQEMKVKRWPVPKYVKLCNELTKNKHVKIMLVGSKQDKRQCDAVVALAKNKKQLYNMAGKATFKQTAALINHCGLFISHDSGLMHTAAAVKTPLIVLFGPTSPKRLGPLNARIIKSRLDCSPCYDIYGDYKHCDPAKCMESIEVEDILSKIKIHH